MSFTCSARLRYTFVGFLSLLLVGVAPRTHAATTTSLLREQEFLPATMCETGQSFWDARANRVEVFADRRVYFADDIDGQFLVAFLGKITPENTNKFSIQLELKDAKSGQSIESKTITIVRGPKLPVIIPTSELKARTIRTCCDAKGRERQGCRASGAEVRAFGKNGKGTGVSVEGNSDLRACSVARA